MRTFLATALVLALAQRAPAQGLAPKDPPPDLINPDRPGIADGSNVIGPRRFQIELGGQREFRADGGVRQRLTYLPTLVRIGLSSRLEARVEGNTFTFARATDPAGATTNSSGSAPVSIGFKYHFEDQPEPLKRPSLGTIVRLFPASGSGGFGSDRAAGDARLVADWALSDRWSLNPNVGVGFYDDGQGQHFVTGLFAVTLNYNPTPRVNPFIDMGVQAPEERGGRTSVIYDAGLAVIAGDNVQVDFSAGKGARGRTPPHRFWALGISARF